mmetsp:Transcript_51886/g.113034  ORF Transcript_51886/g.113034 Transcript_51886/m.113034 type:complete len:283 (+) Transcript_51886:715-1563(+)
MTRSRCPLEQPYLARSISMTPPIPLTSPTKGPEVSSVTKLSGSAAEAKRECSTRTSCGVAWMNARAASAEKRGSGICSAAGLGGSTFLPLAIISNSNSISRPRFARVCSTATESLQPERVPPEMTRFWSSGFISFMISSDSGVIHFRLAVIKASTSSLVAGLESLVLDAASVKWAPERMASFSFACRTRERITPAASRQLTNVPALMTRRWSSGDMLRNSAAAASSIQRLLSVMKASTSSLVAGSTLTILVGLAVAAFAASTLFSAGSSAMTWAPGRQPAGH